MLEMASGLGATTVGIGVSHGTGVSEAVTGGCRLRAQSQSQASNSPSPHSNPQQSSQQQQQQQQTSQQQQQQRQGLGFMGRSKKDNCCLCWCCCCSCSCLAAVGGGNSSGAGGAGDQGKKKGSGGEHGVSIGDGRGGGDHQGAGAGNGLDREGDINDISLEEIRAWGSSFDRLIRNPAGRKLFREFLVKEYSEENIAFWLACEQLKRESNPEIIEEKARHIYNDYISILSPKEVSLDSRVREIVNMNMTNPSPHSFDEAQLQIYTLMHRDSYPRFVSSEIFKKGARIGSGPPSPMCAEHDHDGSIGKSKSKKSMT